MEHYKYVTRVEVIDHNGRSYTFDPRAHPDSSIAVRTSLQDDGRTLKVFIDCEPKIRACPSHNSEPRP